MINDSSLVVLRQTPNVEYFELILTRSLFIVYHRIALQIQINLFITIVYRECHITKIASLFGITVVLNGLEILLRSCYLNHVSGLKIPGNLRRFMKHNYVLTIYFIMLWNWCLQSQYNIKYYVFEQYSCILYWFGTKYVPGQFIGV